ncbi:MAG: UDP-GlcNAc:undecaprenyl-phosphate GlcNAc-1-phosphate transferase [Verrucomicrobia bacterium]|nr:MAG: UDP-GlcNAc:undecaprenyl-phosphate GlcNAc-1-phosphate transferase [Verrucomicrobiota bacterium]
MNPGYIFPAVGLIAAFVSWALVGVVIRLAPLIGLLDRPNERSLHTRATPRGGGLGFVLVVALGCGVLWVVPGFMVVGAPGGWHRLLASYLVAALFIAAVSLRDDFQSLSPGLRLLCQLAVAAGAAGGIGYFQQLTLPGGGALDLGWIGAALTVIWLVGLTNVYNFMDGIDGIAGVQGLTAGLAWTVAGLWLDSPATAWMGLLLAGGCLGFLFHNWSPAKIFMGDVGSAFLGYSFGVLPLLFLRELPPVGQGPGAEAVPLFALLVVWPFVGDGFYTFLQRASRGEPVCKPHRSHLYQRLVRTGWSHARVSSLYATWGVLCGVTALGWLTGAAGSAVMAVVLPLATLAGIFLLVRHREQKTKARYV